MEILQYKYYALKMALEGKRIASKDLVKNAKDEIEKKNWDLQKLYEFFNL